MSAWLVRSAAQSRVTAIRVTGNLDAKQAKGRAAGDTNTSHYDAGLHKAGRTPLIAKLLTGSLGAFGLRVTGVLFYAFESLKH